MLHLLYPPLPPEEEVRILEAPDGVRGQSCPQASTNDVDDADEGRKAERREGGEPPRGGVAVKGLPLKCSEGSGRT